MHNSHKYSSKPREVDTYPRLLSELFHQSKVVQTLESLGQAFDLGIEFGHVLSAKILENMKIIMPKNVIKSDEFATRGSKRQFLQDFPTITKQLSPEVLAELVT